MLILQVAAGIVVGYLVLGWLVRPRTQAVELPAHLREVPGEKPGAALERLTREIDARGK